MKRTISLIMAFALVLTLFAGLTAASAADVTFTDVPSTHWAYPYITYLANKGILVGDGSGRFRPNDPVTRAEFIKMIDEVFGLKTSVATSFTNVPAWASEYIGRAKAQGYLLNYAVNDDFNLGLTREEAVALIMRYLNIQDTGASRVVFTDYHSIHEPFLVYVEQAVREHIISGYSDGSFGPKNVLSRAEALTILYKAAGAIYDQSAYSDSYGAAASNAVVKSSASLYNLHLNGRIIIAEDVQAVNFIDCIITGNIEVRGTAAVTFQNCSVPQIVLKGVGGTLKLSGGSMISKAFVDRTSRITLEEKTKIDTLVVNSGAPDTKIEGKGAIGTIYVYASGVDTGKLLPAKYEIAAGLTATFAGTVYKSAGKGQPIPASGFTSATVYGYSYCYDPRLAYSGYTFPFSTSNSCPYAYPYVWPYVSPFECSTGCWWPKTCMTDYVCPYSKDERSIIVVTFTPAEDGFAYCAAWPKTEKAPGGRQIVDSYIAGYGTYLAVKAGQTYQFEIQVMDSYTNYNVGLVLAKSTVKTSGLQYDKIYEPVYNKGVITPYAAAMGSMAPEAVKAKTPGWSLSFSPNMKCIILTFNQPMYVKNNKGQFVPLSSLSQAELSKIFAVEVSAGGGHDKQAAVTVAVFDGPVSYVYITPDDGLHYLLSYYVYVMESLYGRGGSVLAPDYDMIYMG